MKKIKFIYSILFFFIFLSANVQGEFNPDSVTGDLMMTEEESVATVEGDITKTLGDSAYIQEDYKKAITVYEYLLTEGVSSEIYYNLGNSYYKDDNIARAILNYERALLLNPANKDIQANLEIAQSKTIDKVEVVPDLFFVGWFKSVMNLAGTDDWGIYGILFFVCFLVSLAIFIFSGRVSLKKGGFFCAILCLCLCLVSNIFAFQQKKSIIQRSHAIILSPSVTVRSTPNESGNTLFILHEGHKVKIKDNSMTEWKEIMIEDGNVGWVPSGVLEII
ncbi:MAG: tetratricopeptide repeat protein [Bacteroides sp.]|nr:tetratricopeptide repeat protein [Bacteroides sp.]